MIVGFAGESEEDFEASYSLMEALGVHKIHVFPFSIRPGTRAAFMKDHVEPEVKNERVQRMLQLDHRLKTEWMNQWKGQTVELLVETISRDGVVKGYTPHYLRVHVPPEAGATEWVRNQLVSVRITDVDPENEVALATAVL